MKIIQKKEKKNKLKHKHELDSEDDNKENSEEEEEKPKIISAKKDQTKLLSKKSSLKIFQLHQIQKQYHLV